MAKRVTSAFEKKIATSPHANRDESLQSSGVIISALMFSRNIALPFESWPSVHVKTEKEIQAIGDGRRQLHFVELDPGEISCCRQNQWR